MKTPLLALPLLLSALLLVPGCLVIGGTTTVQPPPKSITPIPFTGKRVISVNTVPAGAMVYQYEAGQYPTSGASFGANALTSADATQPQPFRKLIPLGRTPLQNLYLLVVTDQPNTGTAEEIAWLTTRINQAELRIEAPGEKPMDVTLSVSPDQTISYTIDLKTRQVKSN